MLCVHLHFRYVHPLVVSHATALFEAPHRSINQPLPAAAAAAGGHVNTHEAQALKQEATVQQQQPDQHQEAARYNLRRRSLPEGDRPAPPLSQRTRTSLASQPLHPAVATPSEENSQPEQVPLCKQSDIRMRTGCSFTRLVWPCVSSHHHLSGSSLSAGVWRADHDDLRQLGLALRHQSEAQHAHAGVLVHSSYLQACFRVCECHRHFASPL